MNCAEIWRSEHALDVLKIFSELFKDVDILELSMDFGEELMDDTVDSARMDIRDDSSANLMELSEYSDMEMSLNARVFVNR